MAQRVRGDKGIHFVIDEVDYFAEASSVEFVRNGESLRDPRTGRAYAVLGGEWTLKLRAVQSTDPASLWSLLWDHEGERVTIIYAPHGRNLVSGKDTVTPEKPLFIATAMLGPAPILGGAAGAQDYEFEVDILLDEKPVRVDDIEGLPPGMAWPPEDIEWIDPSEPPEEEGGDDE